MDRSQSVSADYKIATGPFLFCLDKATVLNDFSPLCFHSRANCVSMAQQSIQLLLFVLFFSPTPSKSCVSSSTSNEEAIETAEKTIKTTSYVANEAEIGNKSEIDYSL